MGACVGGWCVGACVPVAGHNQVAKGQLYFTTRYGVNLTSVHV